MQSYMQNGFEKTADKPILNNKIVRRYLKTLNGLILNLPKHGTEFLGHHLLSAITILQILT
jgi:hypothetical protein